MKRARALLGVIALAATPGAGRAAGYRAGPAFPSSIGVSRVRVEVRGDRALVTTDVLIAGDPARARAIEAYAAYGVPGPPLAMDAELVPVPPDRLDAPLDAHGARVDLAAATRAAGDATLVLGPAEMAGARATLDAGALAAALAPSGAVALRVRAVHRLTAARDLLLRLGATGGVPFVLGAVEIAGDATAREARLCGPHADPTPLAVTPRRPGDAPGVAPPLARRAPDDALCVRLAQKSSAGDGVRPDASRW